MKQKYQNMPVNIGFTTLVEESKNAALDNSIIVFFSIEKKTII